MSRQPLNPHKRHTSHRSLLCQYESHCRPASQFNPVTDHNTSACGVRITTVEVAGSFCKPQAAKLRNYCPYSERISGCRSLHTFISDHLSLSLHLYMHLYMYLHQPTTSKSKPLYGIRVFWEITQSIVAIPSRTPKAVTDSSSRNVGKDLQLYVV
jgi:hypothetical protein